jgi:hypothetical protein
MGSSRRSLRGSLLTPGSGPRTLPDTLNAIWGLSVLPNGHLAVTRFTGLDSVEIDLFDGKGRLLWTILPSEEMPDLQNVAIHEKTLGVIFERDDKNVYVEYDVKNIKEMFSRAPQR